MDLGLSGRVALVTASSRGLGRAVAEELAAEGARVVISSRDVPALETVAAEIRNGTGSEVTPIAADLRDPRQVERLVDDTERRVGPIDILVNSSAGPPTKPFAALGDEDWREALDVKLLAQIRPCRETNADAVGPGARESRICVARHRRARSSTLLRQRIHRNPGPRRRRAES